MRKVPAAIGMKLSAINPAGMSQSDFVEEVMLKDTSCLTVLPQVSGQLYS
jgi:hypothetical protein